MLRDEASAQIRISRAPLSCKNGRLAYVALVIVPEPARYSLRPSRHECGSRSQITSEIATFATRDRIDRLDRIDRARAAGAHLGSRQLCIRHII
jgi:hypothetical protein